MHDAACRPWGPEADTCLLSDRGFIDWDHHLDSSCMDQGVASSTYGPAYGAPQVIEDGAMLYSVGAAIDPSTVYHEDMDCVPGLAPWALDWGLFEIGAALAPSEEPVFFFDGEACMPYEIYETDVFKLVEPLAVTEFAAIELTVE